MAFAERACRDTDFSYAYRRDLAIHQLMPQAAPAARMKNRVPKKMGRPEAGSGKGGIAICEGASETSKY